MRIHACKNKRTAAAGTHLSLSLAQELKRWNYHAFWWANDDVLKFVGIDPSSCCFTRFVKNDLWSLHTERNIKMFGKSVQGWSMIGRLLGNDLWRGMFWVWREKRGDRWWKWWCSHADKNCDLVIWSWIVVRLLQTLKVRSVFWQATPMSLLLIRRQLRAALLRLRRHGDVDVQKLSTANALPKC